MNIMATNFLNMIYFISRYLETEFNGKRNKNINSQKKQKQTLLYRPANSRKRQKITLKRIMTS